MIFNYDTENINLPNLSLTDFTLNKFNNQFLKKGYNVINNHDKYKYQNLDIQENIKLIVNGDKMCGNNIIESYRKHFNNTYQCYHDGYINYLYCAYMQDLGIEIAPWYLWNIIFHQVVQIIKSKPDDYKHIFTSSNEKIIFNFFHDEIDIEQYTNAIKQKIPNPEIFNSFFPDWLDVPKFYNESMQGLFADMVQKYYGCMIMGCSLPRVRVLGTNDDWKLLNDSVIKLNNILNIDYLTNVTKYTSFLKDNWNVGNTWKNFFKIINCGSGSQQEVYGDFRKLLNYNINSTLLIDQIPNMISKFPFDNLNNQFVNKLDDETIEIINCKECFFNSGIVGSNIQNINGFDFLIPSYDYSITYIDNRKLLPSTDEITLYQDVYDKLLGLDRISKNSLVEHFTYMHKSFDPRNKFDFKLLLKDKEIEILAIKDKDEQIKKLTIYLNGLLEHNNKIASQRLSNYNENVTYSDGLSTIKTFEDIKRDFDNRVKNGRPYDYAIKMEEKRIKSLEHNYNVWFQDNHKIISDSNRFAKISDCKLTFDNYNKYKNEALTYYEFLLCPIQFKQFYDVIKNFCKVFNSKIDLMNIVLCTLDMQVYYNYYQLLNNNDKDVFLNQVANLCGYDIKNANMTIFKIDSQIKDELKLEFNRLFDNIYISYILNLYNDHKLNIVNYTNSNKTTNVKKSLIEHQELQAKLIAIKTAQIYPDLVLN
jgi:hypothetical protein